MSEPLAITEDLCLNNGLWRFAGQLWSRPDAQEAALMLQDLGWSVTDILGALWLTKLRQPFKGLNSPLLLLWRSQVTSSLRKVRKNIAKNHPATDQARRSVAQSELEAEKVELALAFQALATTEGSLMAPVDMPIRTLAMDNLKAAAPEPEQIMDHETGKLLERLIDELQLLIKKGQQPCS